MSRRIMQPWLVCIVNGSQSIRIGDEIVYHSGKWRRSNRLLNRVSGNLMFRTKCCCISQECFMYHVWRTAHSCKRGVIFLAMFMIFFFSYKEMWYLKIKPYILLCINLTVFSSKRNLICKEMAPKQPVLQKPLHSYSIYGIKKYFRDYWTDLNKIL